MKMLYYKVVVPNLFSSTINHPGGQNTKLLYSKMFRYILHSFCNWFSKRKLRQNVILFSVASFTFDDAGEE